MVRDRLQRARELAEKTVQAIRNISGVLRPSLLDDLGLVPALQFQLEEFLRRSGIACEFVEDGVMDELPDPIKTCVYRVVQEALHNCEKHSGATKVRVIGAANAGIPVGRGGRQRLRFRRQPPRHGTPHHGAGLLGIRERAAIAGGSLVIDSAPGQGTRVSLRIPLKSAGAPSVSPRKEVTA